MIVSRLVLSSPFGRCLVFVLSCSLLAAVAAGCNSTVQDREWKGSGTGTVPGPVDDAKALVQRYADGEQMGSEAMTFDDLVQRVTAADAGKGAKLKKFLDDASKKGVDPSAAKALLKDL